MILAILIAAMALYIALDARMRYRDVLIQLDEVGDRLDELRIEYRNHEHDLEPVEMISVRNS